MADDKTPQPTHYTYIEGGIWLEWPKELIITEPDLEKSGMPNVIIAGLNVHSFAFDNPLINPQKPFRRWDSLNGWTYK